MGCWGWGGGGGTKVSPNVYVPAAGGWGVGVRVGEGVTQYSPNGADAHADTTVSTRRDKVIVGGCWDTSSALPGLSASSTIGYIHLLRYLL